MSIFHKAIRRTFHRKAKNGNLKANGNKYCVSEHGKPFTGDVTIEIRGSLRAKIKGDVFAKLEIEDKGIYRNVGI